MDLLAVFLFVVGLMFLIAGAEALVRGASRLAALMGISPLVIGLTVVAFGTSAPELAVSIRAGLAGQADISLGNVVGSNIFNVLFILGISAAVTPLLVSRQLIRLDVPVMIGVSLLMLVFALNHRISRLEGFILFLCLVGYTAFLIIKSRQEKTAPSDDFAKEYGTAGTKSSRSGVVSIVLIIGGLILLVLGSRWLVDGAVKISRAMGVSELVIGLTVIAAGTSLPEAATSVIASLRKERDIAVGNVVGSNIFNILSVLGISAAISPAGISVSPAALHFDIPVMIAISFACLPIFFTGYVISRWEGLLFLSYYVFYAIYLILAASHHQALPAYSGIMVIFVIPITVITLLIIFLRAARKNGAGR